MELDNRQGQPSSFPENEQPLAHTPLLNISVQQTHRFECIDTLRGFALLGLLTMNFITFAMPFAAYMNPMAYLPESTLNMWAYSFTHIFADQKFMGIFSLLFGASVLLIIENAEAKKRSPAKLHYSRNFWLLVFGLAHAIFLWDGDVLFIYSICALFLYPFRKLPWWLLVVLGSGIYLSSISYFLSANDAIASLDANSFAWLKGYWAPSQEALNRDIQLYLGSFTEQLQNRLGDSDDTDNPGQDLFLVGLLFDGFSRSFGMMLIGMAAYKSGFITGLKSLKVYKNMALVGFALGVPIVSYGLYLSFEQGFSAEYGLFIGRIPNHIASLFMVFGYVGLIHWLIKRHRLMYLQSWLSAVGKLALTNYLLQTVIGSVIFYGWGLGLYGQLSRGQVLLMIPVIAGLQIALSVFWCRYFCYGPVEWLWRFLSQWKLPKMLKN